MDRDAKDVPSDSTETKKTNGVKQSCPEAAGTSNSNRNYKTASNYKPSNTCDGSKYLQTAAHADAVLNKIKCGLRRYVVDNPVCFLEKKREYFAKKNVSNKIDRQLKKDHQWCYKVLIFGLEQSGKSTIINQMRIMHGNGFTDEDKEEIAKNIKRNVKDAILAILTAMSWLVPSAKLEKIENQVRVDYIHTCISTPKFDYSLTFFEHIEALWKDKGIQEAYERRNEYNLIDCAKYFFNRISVIKEKNYVPTQADILHCHTAHDKGIFDIHFKCRLKKECDFGGPKTIVGHFHVSEIVNQAIKPHLWTYFHDLSVLIFVAACNTYDVVRRNDEPKNNHLLESIELFKCVTKNKWTSCVPIILFLNKEDLLSEKVIAGKNKLENYFPDFAGYKTPQVTYFQVNDPEEVIRHKCFILEKFLQHSYRESMPYFYFHFTSAINTKNLESVVNTCTSIIRNLYKDTYSLI